MLKLKELTFPVRLTLLTAAILLPCFSGVSFSQSLNFEASKQESFSKPVSTSGALLRSFVVPGWGHYYVDKGNWTRGKIHLAADITMIAAYFGFDSRANRLETTLNTLVSSKAGVTLSGKGRDFEIAMAQYNTLSEYNDAQLRTRNWQNLIDDTAENRWNWESTDDRIEFNDTRDRIATSENQLTTIVTLMVANRLLSGINAFTRARDMNRLPEATLSYINEFGEPGVTAKLRFSF